MKRASGKQVEYLERLYFQKGEAEPKPSFFIALSSQEAGQEIERLMKLPTVEFGDNHYQYSSVEIAAARAEDRAERQP